MNPTVPIRTQVRAGEADALLSRIEMDDFTMEEARAWVRHEDERIALELVDACHAFPRSLEVKGVRNVLRALWWRAERDASDEGVGWNPLHDRLAQLSSVRRFPRLGNKVDARLRWVVDWIARHPQPHYLEDLLTLRTIDLLEAAARHVADPDELFLTRLVRSLQDAKPADGRPAAWEALACNPTLTSRQLRHLLEQANWNQHLLRGVTGHPAADSELIVDIIRALYPDQGQTRAQRALSTGDVDPGVFMLEPAVRQNPEARRLLCDLLTWPELAAALTFERGDYLDDALAASARRFPTLLLEELEDWPPERLAGLHATHLIPLLQAGYGRHRQRAQALLAYTSTDETGVAWARAGSLERLKARIQHRLGWGEPDLVPPADRSR